MSASDYADRIPAAIARAEEELDGADSVSVQRQQIGVDTVVVTITATELALAKALWEMTLMIMRGKEPGIEFIPPALIEFTEEIESL